MIFVTGSTGFLGREFLRKAVTSSKFQDFSLLIRSSRGVSAEARGSELLLDICGKQNLDRTLSRFQFVEGDLREPKLGLGDSQFSELARNTSKILHCGASVDLNQDRDSAEGHNIAGTKAVLDLAYESKRLTGSFAGFYHVSTAYVAGDTQSIVSARDLRVQGPFRNHYERSKAEAEALVRDAEKDFPICIFRPSVVVGNSVTGKTTSFNVIYIPARMFVSGVLRVFPALPSAPFDVVPVDYVAASMVALMEKELRNESCYHLCTGYGRESSPLEMLQCLIATMEKYCHRTRGLPLTPAWIAPEILSLVYSSLSLARNHMRSLEKHLKGIERLLAEHWETIRHVLPFLPYMIQNPRFDMEATHRELAGISPESPLFVSYAERLFKYCIDTNWGRKAIVPA